VRFDDGGTYWDGLFSQNPPVRELTDEGPDEIWVIQINPKERESEPKTVAEIADRRNELSGNLSLHQELGFIERIDQMLEEGHLVPNGKYRQIVVRVIELSRSRFSRFLGTASKLNRDPHFIRDLIAHGEARAEEFLTALAFEDAWKSRDPAAIMSFFARDAEIFSSAPFANGGIHKGTREVREFVADILARGVSVDPTRKQVARNGVAWTVRLPADADSPGRRMGIVEAEFQGGSIIALRLGGGS
jgi:NTE family protein